MSRVTNVMLNMSGESKPMARLEEVNEFFEEMEEEMLASLKPVVQGAYAFSEVYIGAYHRFPLEEFIAHLQSIEWEHPEHVQLFVQDEEDSEFRVVKIA